MAIMTYSQLLESMDEISSAVDSSALEPVEDMEVSMSNDEPTSSIVGPEEEKEILDHLNQVFTPILVRQGFENNIADKIQEAYSEASVLTERNIINFDDKSRMSQLIATCALLIAQKKKSPKFDMYRKAAELRNKMKLDIQKDNYDEAKVLAQKFLVKVSTTNNSAVARDAAQDLLPETQH